jgi:hypothetical protein
LRKYIVSKCGIEDEIECEAECNVGERAKGRRATHGLEKEWGYELTVNASLVDCNKQQRCHSSSHHH